MYDLIVVGGGPAGLTATIYAIRKRISVLMVSRDLGGKTQWRLALPWIEDYQVIKGLQVVNVFKSELEYLDFARHMEKVEKISQAGDNFVVHTSGSGELEAKAVIVASGTKQMLLRVPGEKRFMMKGLCYSALSYAPLFIDRTAVVIGDGDLAMRSAAELSTIAEKVYLVCEGEGKGLTSPIGQKVKSTNNISIMLNQEIVEFKGDDYARSVILKSNGDLQELNTDGIFIEKALIPNSQMVADLVELDDNGHILVDCANCTNVPGIYAAGDVASGFAEQVLIAVGEGAKAALSAYEYLLPKL